MLAHGRPREAAGRGPGGGTAPTRDDLSHLAPRRLSSGRNRTKADVLVFEWDDRQIVVKDFRPRGILVRNTIGRFSVAREWRAYERLSGLAGVPEPLAGIDAHAIAFAYLGGAPLHHLGERRLPTTFFEDLRRLLAAIHGRGIAIADLHHRNVLVTEPAGTPGLIDFSLALVRPAAWNLPGRWIYRRVQELDLLALERIRERYHALHDGAAGRPEKGGIRRLHGLGRALKRGLRRLRGVEP